MELAHFTDIAIPALTGPFFWGPIAVLYSPFCLHQ